MPNPVVVEQRRQGRTQRAGPGQRLLRAHALADMGQETLDRVEPGGRPAVPVDRVVDDPDDPRATRPVQAHVDAVAGAGAGQQLVVRRGGLEFRLGVEVGDMAQPAVGETPHARGPFVPGVVGLEVFPLQRPVPLSADERPRKEDPDVLFGVAVAEHHAAAVRAEGVVDERGGARPVRTVERRFVQRGQDGVERLPFAHRRAVACDPTATPIPIGSCAKNPPSFR